MILKVENISGERYIALLQYIHTVINDSRRQGAVHIKSVSVKENDKELPYGLTLEILEKYSRGDSLELRGPEDLLKVYEILFQTLPQQEPKPA